MEEGHVYESNETPVLQELREALMKAAPPFPGMRLSGFVTVSLWTPDNEPGSSDVLTAVALWPVQAAEPVTHLAMRSLEDNLQAFDERRRRQMGIGE